MTPRRPDAQGPRRSLGAPLSIAASLTLSACLLGSIALVAHADEAAVPVVSETTAQAVVVDPTAQAVASAPTAREAAPAPAAQTSAPTVSPAPVSPAASAAPAATASGEATVHATAAPATPAPTAPAAEAPIAPAPALQDAPADAPAAATETPVSAPQQQPTPAASASMSDGVTATVKGVLDLKPGETPTVGTPVKWTITLHNTTSHPVDVLKALLHLEPGESGDVEDNLAPTTLTQADLDAGRVTYASRYDVVSHDGRQIIRAQGALELAKTATTWATTPAPTTTPTTPAPDTTPSTTAADQVTASVRGALDLKPGETPTVGTPVKWTITLHNTTSHPVDVLKALLHLEPGESGDVEDNLAPTTLTQADLDAGRVTYASRYDVVSNDVRQIIRAQGALELASTTTPTTPAAPTAPTTPTTPTSPASQAPDAPAHAAQTSSIRGELLLTPGDKVTADTRVKWTVTITNTGEVPLHNVDNGHTGERVDLAVGQSKDLTITLPLGQSALANGTATLTARTSGTTDTGVLVHSRATGTLTLPTTTTPTSTPTTPATPTVPTTPTAPASQAPDAPAHAAQTSSDRTAH
ncbi:hypothetical protein [Rathayibacter sp. VKM Ac-2857]|uniref:hypothetical protein n=1 Tax=Rathayibacter sp. VKM Ac-2857 TaxID=2739020 RepID=UPI0015641B90|nr:hypothetical protein [Rathayibacter sp. VKM Ac-2857]NQX16747.1 hypothetical protein [Rathayibacter sp. VKM Ac-2857]